MRYVGGSFTPIATRLGSTSPTPDLPLSLGKRPSPAQAAASVRLGLCQRSVAASFPALPTGAAAALQPGPVQIRFISPSVLLAPLDVPTSTRPHISIIGPRHSTITRASKFVSHVDHSATTDLQLRLPKEVSIRPITYPTPLLIPFQAFPGASEKGCADRMVHQVRVTRQIGIPSISRGTTGSIGVDAPAGRDVEKECCRPRSGRK